MSAEDLSQFSMLDLFRVETENQTHVLTAGLLALERDDAVTEQLEACMRAAHSLKGAARIVGIAAGVGVANAMENCFVSVQQGRMTLLQPQIDLLLRGVDLLGRIARTPEADLGQWTEAKKGEVDAFVGALTLVLEQHVTPVDPGKEAAVTPARAAEPHTASIPAVRENSDGVLRVTAVSLNRLLGLSSESVFESRWLKPFADSLARLKRLHHDSGKSIEAARNALSAQTLVGPAQTALTEVQNSLLDCQQFLSARLTELEMFDRRSTHLSQRLYDEALACRMRPFGDVVQGFPRVVRDTARSLGKQAKLEIIGVRTQVDRDILESLDAPLGHLLRNAVDHGIEGPEERLAAGKSAEGVVRLEAQHSAGTLQVIVSDDGRGIVLDDLRQTVVERNLTSADQASKLSDAELLEFLFLPGFTMKDTVTEISGRGVGLDVVQDMVKQVHGTVTVVSKPGVGAQFRLQLPITLSIVRTLLVDIGGEPYAFPLAYILRTVKLPKEKIEVLENRQHFNFEGRQISLVDARQVLEVGEPKVESDSLSVILVGRHSNTYGLVVDRFIGERELVVQPLGGQLGKIKDIAAGALMEDGTPVLIVDTEDMIRSVDKLVSAGRLGKVQEAAPHAERKGKRVLVVDDSLTVRELERKLIGNHGYEVEVAVDGMDGWNAVRTGSFDLVVTDIDMPRMDGIELVTLMKKDPNLSSLPVMIVSYKDREEDRQRGLDAGADYYLTKGSFHDETLVQAIVDLIGEAGA